MATNDSCSSATCTLERLIADLDSIEQASPDARFEPKRLGGSQVAQFFDIVATPQRFHPDSVRMPGIERIEVLCDEMCAGTGLTAANVRRVRARYCLVKLCSLQQANSCPLIDVASALESNGYATDSAAQNGDNEPHAKLSEALALLLVDGPNVAAIARKIGVPRTTLASWPTFKAALQQVRAKAAAEKESRRRRLASATVDSDNDDE